MKLIYVIFSLVIFSCAFQVNPELSPQKTANVDNIVQESETTPCLLPLHPKFKTGADQMEKLIPLLIDKRVGLIGNPSSQVNGIHLVDTLLNSGIALQRIFCPEHGFRGEGAAGAKIDDSTDPKTGLQIVSLYGKNKKPKAEDLVGLDILIFDIQDVGARFYTYISTLHYVMEAAAENEIPLLVLDRPNPNGHVVDGPVLQKDFKSFVGMHPIPVCHGMTIGEYAKMIQGESWLEANKPCDLSILSCSNYTHHMRYELPIKPSPNLPNAKSVYLYPSLCFFEGTTVSIGRGTDTPFQMYGHPQLEENGFSFTPKPRKEAPHPKLEGQTCSGHTYDENQLEALICKSQLDLSPLIQTYKSIHSKNEFFTRPDFFDLLAGSSTLRNQILDGVSEKEIRNSWEDELLKFKKTRSNYLIYP